MCHFNKFFFLVLIGILAACTSQYVDRDEKSEDYRSGKSAIQLGPSARRGDPDDHRGTSLDAGGAALGAAMSAVAIAGHPEYYRKSSISGRCVFDTGGGKNFDVSCQNTTVILKSLQGAEIARTQVQDGQFVFRVEKGRTYLVEVDATGYQLEKPVSAIMGDSILLRLQRK